MEKKEEKERVFGKWVPAGTQPKSENSLINECIITIDSVLSDSIQLTKFTEDLYNFIKNEDVDNYAMNMQIGRAHV